MNILQDLKDRARAYPQRIVLPEGEDPRVLQAAARIAREGFARVTLLGKPDVMQSSASGVSLKGVELVDPAAGGKLDAYARLYLERRRSRGVSEEEARRTAAHPLYCADLMVAAGEADGSVGGAAHTTAETVRAALHCIGLAQGWTTLSSFFLMLLPQDVFGVKGALLYADCGVVPDPNPQQLAEIALQTAENTRACLQAEPLVALLSCPPRAVPSTREWRKSAKPSASPGRADRSWPLTASCKLMPPWCRRWGPRKPPAARSPAAPTRSSFPTSTPPTSATSLPSGWRARSRWGRFCKGWSGRPMICRGVAPPTIL